MPCQQDQLWPQAGLFNFLIFEWKWVRILKCSAYKTSYLAPSWVKIPVLRTEMLLIGFENILILLALCCICFCINHIKMYFLLLWRPQSYSECIHFDFKFFAFTHPGLKYRQYHIFLQSLFIQMPIYIKKILWNKKSRRRMFKITTNHMKWGKSILCRVHSILVIKCSYFN